MGTYPRHVLYFSRKFYLRQFDVSQKSKFRSELFRSHSKIWYVDPRTNSDFRSRSFDIFPPTLWKHANKLSVFKKASKTDVKNYKLISLLNIGSKVLEKIMFDTIFRCFIELWSNRQYGFRPGLSPVLRILQTLPKFYDSGSH